MAAARRAVARRSNGSSARRVGERIARGREVRRRAEQDPLHRHLELLARQRPRDRRDGLDRVGHVARRQAVPQPRAIARRRSSSSAGRRGNDEQQQLARPASRVLEVHDEAVGDLRQRLDDAVELAVPMRTPPRLRVASLRPVITHEPRSVIVSQSPWRQTPGYVEK